MIEEIAPDLYLFRDTCHVYVIRNGDEAVLVDFGDGAVLDELNGMGVNRVTDILFTHHHRDQGQGLPRVLAAEQTCLAGVRVWAPYNEQELFHSIDQHWQSRALLNNYDVRQDRFSLLEPVSLAGTLQDYGAYTFGGREWQVLATPGHTPGSITLLLVMNDRKFAFTGDLIAGPGKLWSMAALQWSYHALEGAPAMIPALAGLLEQNPAWLLPSHGELMSEPRQAVKLLVERLLRLLAARGENPNLLNWMKEPYVRITPHLLLNRTSLANSYALLSNNGKALVIDYGYDFLTANISGADRAIHRPWLFSLPALKRDFGVSKIDVVIATHAHDDHVAGFNLLRSVEGAQVWAAETFAAILAHPDDYNLPCLWYDPIPVDRVLPLEKAIEWEEYALTLYPLPGHTRYAVAIGFEVDGKRVLATGDQYKGEGGTGLNFVYQNRFEIDDYCASAELFRRYAPDLLLPGHWQPFWTDAGYFRKLGERGEEMENLHRELLPLEAFDPGAEGFTARILPYHWTGAGGAEIHYKVEVRNPLHSAATIRACFVFPTGWHSDPMEQFTFLEAGSTGSMDFQVFPPLTARGRRFRLAVDLVVGDLHLGQQAEALVDLI